LRNSRFIATQGDQLKKLKQAGFSYIQVLMVSSGLAALALLGLKLSEEQGKLVAQLSERLEAEAIVRQIAFILDDPLTCKETFIGLAPIGPGPRQLRRRRFDYRERQEAVVLEHPVGSGPPSVLLGLSKGPIIDKYTLSDSSEEVSVDRGSVHLEISFSRSAEASGPGMLLMRLPLKISLDSEKKIAGCQTLREQGKPLAPWEDRAEGVVGLPSSHSLVIADKILPSVPGELVVAGGVLIHAHELTPCSLEYRGAIRYRRHNDTHEACDGQGKWHTLGQKPLSQYKRQRYVVRAQGISAQKLETSVHLVCAFSRRAQASSGGGCKLAPKEAGGWELEAYSSSSIADIQCEVNCYD
jgi:hypothetical protein